MANVLDKALQRIPPNTSAGCVHDDERGRCGEGGAPPPSATPTRRQQLGCRSDVRQRSGHSQRWELRMQTGYTRREQRQRVVQRAAARPALCPRESSPSCSCTRGTTQPTLQHIQRGAGSLSMTPRPPPAPASTAEYIAGGLRPRSARRATPSSRSIGAHSCYSGRLHENTSRRGDTIVCVSNSTVKLSSR